MDKIKNLLCINKRGMICILVITIIGIISGCLFFYLLSSDDRVLVLSSIENYFTNINDFDSLLSIKSNLLVNVGLIMIMWLLGISIIGIPIILIIYFLKTFSLGLITISIITKYGFKGILMAFIYLFPHNVIIIISFGIMAIYGIICSFKLLSNFGKKMDYSVLFGKYRLILVLSIVIISICSLYQSFIVPYIMKILLNIIK